MNKTNLPDPDLDNLLKQALKDDLPAETEAEMNRSFSRLRQTFDHPERLPVRNGWVWVRGPFRKEILAVVSAAMIILGLGMQLRGSHGALAHSIEQLKVIVTVSAGLHHASSMNCTVLIPEAEGEQISYRVRWRANGDVRVDMDSIEGAQTLWISNNTIAVAGPKGGDLRSMPIDTISPGPVWQPALEFLSPEIIATSVEERYVLTPSSGRTGEETNEFLIIGLQGQQEVEIIIDSRTYLPKVLKKYALDSGRTNGDRPCLMEVRFEWNQLIAPDLFLPGPQAEKP